ncbi:MAG: potassium channel protein [Micromonosporaceae bacterium]|nr:potassium channel protein [Micromonosporaceae bacterium]
MTQRTGETGRSGGHFIVCGDDPLSHRLVDELARRYQRPVTVILESRQQRHGPAIAKIPGVRIVERARLDTEAFRAAGVATAAALALVRQDDVGNIHAALQAQELNPHLRLVLRMFNMRLGHSIRPLLNHCRVLSDASIAAPAFVASALGEAGWVAPTYIRLAGRTLRVAGRSEVERAHVVCGLADTTAGAEAVLLPENEDRCDLVLAVADGRAPRPEPGRSERRRSWSRFSPANLFGPRVSRFLSIAAAGLFAVLVLGTGLLALVSHNTNIWQAAYETLLNTFGGAGPDLNLSWSEQVLQVVVALSGVAMIPVVTAAVVEAVVNARLALALGRLRVPVADHVVVAGLGNVGTRVIEQLRSLGIPVVAIDQSEGARGIQLARDLGVPLVIGDASREETLREAYTGSARALVTLSTNDVVNLEAALNARAMNPEIRVILRLFDGDFADRVQRAFGITASKSVSLLAAPTFTSAMLEREVVGTIPVNRQLLLVAEVPVEPGSSLADQAASQAEAILGIRVLGVTPARQAGGWLWRVPGDHPRLPGERELTWEYRLREGDRLTVVATSSGLERLLARTTPVPVPPASSPAVTD